MNEKKNPVGWFEIPVIDMKRAKAFYEHVFSLSLQDQQMGDTHMALLPMFQGAAGAAGCLVKGKDYTPAAAGVLIYFTAPDLEGMLQRVRQRGGRVLMDKSSIGSYGFIALIQDTEGNRIGLHRRL